MHAYPEEDYRKQVHASMGELLGELFCCLVGELAVIYQLQGYYKELFVTSAERVDLLNKTTGSFASVMQETILDSITLKVSRLCDAPHTSKCGEKLDTFSLRLIEEAAKEDDRLPELAGLISKAIELMTDFKVIRNKSIAHLDFDCNEGPRTSFNYLSYSKTEEVLSACGRIVEYMSHQCMGSALIVESVRNPYDAVKMLRYLKAGMESPNALKRWGL